MGTAPVLNEYRRFDGELRYTGGHDNTGLNECHKSAELAAQASADLRTATQSLFRKWERANGFVDGAGQILLPAGYRP